MRSLAFWIKVSVFNFFIVALLGVLMRYKIALSLVFLDQKHLQEAHSHLSFYGWITSCIYLLIAYGLKRNYSKVSINKYICLNVVNIITSYGMLASFLYGGYYWLSIGFSVMAIFIGFVFFFFLISDAKIISDDISFVWFLGGAFFSVLSSLGVFSITYMLIRKAVFQNVYLASTYFYLHFQYNGFFVFSCIGLLINSLRNKGIVFSKKLNLNIFILLFIGCIFGFGLSVLWIKLPLWLYILVIFATVLQTIGTIKIAILIKNNWQKFREKQTGVQQLAFFLVSFAFLVKITLQMVSVIPSVSQFAFGFRNIVIAYLHLILLMCISIFLINEILNSNLFIKSKALTKALVILFIGILCNEIVLGLMGILSLSYITIPYSAIILLVISVIMMLALFFIFLNLKQRNNWFD